MSVVVLMYHGVERRPGPLFVEPSLFVEQLDAIVDAGVPALTVSELAAGLDAGRLPAHGVAITFDDGFASVVEHAGPALLDRGLRATVFCVAGRLGGSNAWPSARPGAVVVPLANGPDLTRLAALGFEIGGHGLEHAPLDTTDAVTIRREVAEGRRRLESAVGVAVRSFAYPYGARPSPAAAAAVAQAYRAACTTRIGRVGPGSDLLALPRVDAHYLRSPERLAAVLGGEANAYLALRRAGASARRRVVADYRRG